MSGKPLLAQPSGIPALPIRIKIQFILPNGPVVPALGQPIPAERAIFARPA